MGKISKSIDEFIIKQKLENISKGAWNREQEQILDYRKKPTLGIKDPKNPIKTPNIKKYKKYLKQDEKPPKGQQMMRGAKGAYWYETGGRQTSQGQPAQGQPAQGQQMVPRKQEFEGVTPNMPESYVQAKKRPDGKWKLFFVGTRNEVFPNELFNSASEAKMSFRVAKAKLANQKEQIARDERKFAMEEKRPQSEPYEEQMVQAKEQSKRAFAPGGIQDRFNRQSETSRM